MPRTGERKYEMSQLQTWLGAVATNDVAPVSTGHLQKGKSDVRNDNIQPQSAWETTALHA